MVIRSVAPKTSFEKILELSGWLAVTAMWVLAFFCYGNLPESIPLHFNAEGPNDYGHKMTLLVLPAIVTIVFIGLTVLNRFPHFFNLPVRIHPGNAEFQYQSATNMIRWLKLLIVVISTMIILMVFDAAQGGTQIRNPIFIIAVLAMILVPILTFTIRSLASK